MPVTAPHASHKLKTLLITLLLLSLTTISMAQIELVFRQSDPPNETPGIPLAIEKWNAEHPDIQVRLENVPWADALNQYVREVQAGGGADVEQVAFVWTRDLAVSDLVMNLDDFIANDPPGNGIEDFLGTDLGVYNDSVYGIPFSVDTNAMAYRADLLDAAGVTPPDTWQELFEVSKTLTQDTDDDGRIDQYGFCFPGAGGETGSQWFIINYYLWSNGKFLVQETTDGTWEVGVTSEDLVDAITYFNTYFSEGYAPEYMIGISNVADAEYVGALARGECAIQILPQFTLLAAQQSTDAPIKTTVIPQGNQTRISHLGGRALVINPNTEHPEAAWEFLTYLTSQDFYTNYYNTFNPAQVSLLETIEYPEILTGYQQQLPYAITFKQYIVSPAPVSGLWAATNREFNAVYSGQKDPEKAANDLIAAIQKLLDQ